MVRGKVKLKRIELASSRHATFSKRRTGLLKKAHELSVLCDAQVAVIIFSQSGRLYDFSSSNMQETLERYRIHTQHQNPTNPNDMEQYVKGLKHGSMVMSKQIEALELETRKFLGQCLGSCSFKELQEIESQLDRSLSIIRTRKDQLFKYQIEQLKANETLLLESNKKLCTEEMPAWRPPSAPQGGNTDVSSSYNLTELSIGLPEMSAPSLI